MVAQKILFYLWMSSLLKFGPKAAGQGQACNFIVPMRRLDLEEQIRIRQRPDLVVLLGKWINFKILANAIFGHDLSFLLAPDKKSSHPNVPQFLQVLHTATLGLSQAVFTEVALKQTKCCHNHDYWNDVSQLLQLYYFLPLLITCYVTQIKLKAAKTDPHLWKDIQKQALTFFTTFYLYS